MSRRLGQPVGKKCLISRKSMKNRRFGQNLQLFRAEYHVLKFWSTSRQKVFFFFVFYCVLIPSWKLLTILTYKYTHTYDTYNTQRTSLHIIHTLHRFNIIMTSAVQDYCCINLHYTCPIFQNGCATCYKTWRPTFQVDRSS